MAGRGSSDVQIWGIVAVVAAALAVVGAYLVDGEPLVLAVAVVEVLLVMVYVARRFRAGEHERAATHPHDAAHCERCRRAREAVKH